MNLTTEEIFKEYAKCLMNPTYAIESYLETFDKTQEGFVPFKLFPRQIEIIFAYEKNRFNLVTKPRQAGVSTTTAAYMSIKVGFADADNPEAILIIANKQELAFEFLAKIKDFLSQLPRWVWGSEYYGNSKNESKTIFLTDSKKEIKLPNGSRVKAVATSKDALRGFTPTFLIMDEAAYIDNGAEVFGAALTALGCLTKDSLILTENGLVEMGELVKEKEKIGFTDLETPHIVCNKNGELTQATKTFVSEYGETYRIKTKLGIELEGSWKHPILIKRNNEEIWVKMNELVIGDKPVINYGQNYFGKTCKFDFSFKQQSNQKNINIPLHLSDNLDFCYLLGLFVAEGNFISRGINITNVDEQITNFLINDIAKLGNGFKQVDDRHYQFYSTELVKWFEEFGLKKHNARDKEIPLPILKMPKEVIKSFLQGMFDGDGMSTIKDIKYSSTSKKLINSLQTLLLNFGIISHVKKEIQKTSDSSILSNKDHICVIYNLKIYSDYAIKFYNEIGFRLERKQKNKEYLINKKLNSRYVNVSQKTILNILQKNGLIKSNFRFLERFWSSKYERLSYESLKRLIVEVPDNEVLLNISKQIKNNEKYYIDEIIEITKSEDYTYDLHVPETNSFISNGIISHNTGGRATLISTPNGMDSLYYKTYDQARSKKNDFNIIEMKWYEDLRYNKDLRWVKDEVVEVEVEFTFDSYNRRISDGWKPTSSWYEDMCRGMNNDAKMIAQELDVSFIGSGGNVISEEYIEFHEKNNVMEPIYVSGIEKETWIWAEPQEGHQYVMGCLPPDEKVLTDKGLKNIQDVEMTDKLISENGNYVDIINKQIYPVVNEDIFEVQVDNTFRTTTFTKEHPLLISKPNLKRNYLKNHESLKFNERYWDFNFNYTRTEEVEVGDWIKVPNIYKKEVEGILDDKWVINNNVRCDFEIESPLKDSEFWWFVGMWLGDGWLGKNKHSHSISICFDSKDEYYLNKTNELIIRLFDRSPSFIDKGKNTFELVFNSKFLYYFLLENFGQYSDGKKISEWVKYIPKEYKIELIKGYFASDGCWLKTEKNGKINSKISFVSVNLELLESVQDIIFSLGIISSLNKLRNANKNTHIQGKLVNQKEAYNLCLANQDSLDLVKLLNNDKLDTKLNRFNCNEFNIINKRIIKSCHFNKDKNFIYFRIKNINKTKFTGNVYNFECDTHTFMCHHITTHNCDVSRGDGEDSSTIVILDFTTMEQVMEYQGKIQPDLLAQIVEEYGNLYNAYVIVDVTGGMGVSTVLKLLEFDYKRLHYDNQNGKILSARQRELSQFNKDNKIPGFHATSVRLPMIANLEYKIRTNEVKIRSTRMTSEMNTFIYKNGRPDHMEGYHDDLLMAMAMCLWVIEHSFKNLEKLEKQNKAILNSWIGGSSVQTPQQKEAERSNSFVSKNKQVMAKPKFNPQVSRNMQDPTGQYAWLFSGMK